MRAGEPLSRVQITAQRKTHLSRGRKNLAAMKAAQANSKTSPAGKKTLAEMIVQQTMLNEKLEKALTVSPAANVRSI
jgi:hypothetical protein